MRGAKAQRTTTLGALREGEKLVNIIMGCEHIEHRTVLESPFSTEPLGSISQALRGPPQQSHVNLSNS